MSEQTGLQVQSLNPKVDGAPVSVAEKPLQVRGRSFTAVVIKLTGPADATFYGAIESLMRQAPHFFVNAPLVIDLAEAPELREKSDFIKLVRDMRARRLSVIGVQNGTADQDIAAFGAGLVCLQGGRDAPVERGGRQAQAEPSAPVAAAPAPVAAKPEPEAPAEQATLVITEPVRSGQRIFADRGDLVVLAAVSSGAELIAHGNIHVYGPLRGRALAGVNGDKTARIFCQSLEAELVAIAGLYRASDDLDPSVRRGRVQAFLRDDTLCFEPLK
ncbi:MAG: septum site-determining protein MinC [Rhodovulum sulfidophilum]|uniref:Probable septum site-determining protein MinC n=1 Tax=Rhodovulum sulfidophilum TaxID=35806 RepID=A0A2W5N0W7_RHOSU|nr:MAG: septum site-determining protein MinC [Rhodovulum sulfidophilum]